MDKKCINCIYAGVERIKGYDALVCKRYAPRWISGVGTGETDQNFPIVYSDEWCGEFVEGENGLSE